MLRGRGLACTEQICKRSSVVVWLDQSEQRTVRAKRRKGADHTGLHRLSHGLLL